MNLQNPVAAKNHLAGVLYCSQATDEMSSAQLHQIIKTSQRNNSRRNITGLLAYGGGMFVQWLEGPRYEVRKLMAALAADPRHETIVRLQKLTSLKTRLYPSWSMQSVAPDSIRDALVGCISMTRNVKDQELILQMIELMEDDQYPVDKRQTAPKLKRSFQISGSNVGAAIKSLFSSNRGQYRLSEFPSHL